MKKATIAIPDYQIIPQMIAIKAVAVPINRVEENQVRKMIRKKTKWRNNSNSALNIQIPHNVVFRNKLLFQPNYDFIAPWEFDRLDAWGFRLNGTGCLIIICGDVSLDLIGSLTTGEGTLFITPGVHFGLGYGVDGSAGLVGAYDAPYNSSLAEASRNLSINITPGTGGQGSYSVSESPNVTGNYAQTYTLAVSAGGEASAVYGPSYSIPIGTCTNTECYWGVK